MTGYSGGASRGSAVLTAAPYPKPPHGDDASAGASPPAADERLYPQDVWYGGYSGGGGRTQEEPVADATVPSAPLDHRALDEAVQHLHSRAVAAEAARLVALLLPRLRARVELGGCAITLAEPFSQYFSHDSYAAVAAEVARRVRLHGLSEAEVHHTAASLLLTYRLPAPRPRRLRLLPMLLAVCALALAQLGHRHLAGAFHTVAGNLLLPFLQ